MNAYRKELKFIVDDATILDVRCRISGIMNPDVNQEGDHYTVRSVYFDDSVRSCCRENLAGVSPREKYRIRTYNCSSTHISAQIKVNCKGAVTKHTTLISRDLFDTLTAGDPANAAARLSDLITRRMDEGDETGRYVLEKYLAVITARCFRPACMIGYERCAYVYPTGNVRITFDRNVTVSPDPARMFDPDPSGMCVLSGNRHILEIKYDEFLPEEISSLLSGAGLFRTSFSKYVSGMEVLTDAGIVYTHK